MMMMDDDKCGGIGGLLGKGTEVFGENLPHCLSAYPKSHMT
jgi:hypothetical protein